MSGLEVHHIVERCNGGSNDPDNLIVLCSDCHNEWTFFEPPAEVMSFARWLAIPPGRYLVAAFAHEWPSDQSARDFKRDIELTIARTREAFEASKR